MQKPTKQELQVFVPIVIGTTLNLIASLVHSDYVQGLLQGMAVMLLCCAIYYTAWGFKRITKPSNTSKNGNY